MRSKPLGLDLTYLTPDIGTEVLGHPLETNDLFALIEEVSGQRLGSAALALEAIPADAHSAATLQVPDGAALLMLERLTSLADATPLTWSTSGCVAIASPCAAA